MFVSTKSERSSAPMEQKILITGAAGTIGSMLRHSLAQPDRHLRLLDVAAQSELSAGESAELIVGSFLNLDTMSEACRDVSVVIHLGGLSSGGYSWDEYLRSEEHTSELQSL